jgi:uncharacterized delta-60 repeat protein
MMTKQLPLQACVGLQLALSGALSAQPGTLDPDFNGAGYVVTPVNNGDNAQKILVQPDQKVLTVGMSFDATFTSRAQVFRYLPDGTLDTDFGTDGGFTYTLDFEANLYSAALTSEGKIVLVGSTTDYQTYRVLLIRLNADGTLDNDFGTGGVVAQAVTEVSAFGEDKGFDLTLDADGNILVAGTSFSADYVDRPVVLRFTPAGALDTSFGTNGVATIPVGEYRCDFKAIAVQPDGKIVAAGTYGSGLQWWVFLLARFEADGSLDSGFGTNGVVQYNYGNVDDEAEDLALLPDGSILVAGFTATQSFNYSALLMKFTPEGILDATFSEDGIVEEDLGQYDYAAMVEVQTDGRVVMAGTSGEGPPNAFDMAVWKYNADGSRDLSFGNGGVAQPVLPGYSAMIYGMDLQADGNIVIGGQARTPENQNHFLTARLRNDLVSGVEANAATGKEVLFPNPAVAGTSVVWQLHVGVDGRARLSIIAGDGRRVAEFQANGLQRVQDGLRVDLPANMVPGAYRMTLDLRGERSSVQLIITE